MARPRPLPGGAKFRKIRQARRAMRLPIIHRFN